MKNSLPRNFLIVLFAGYTAYLPAQWCIPETAIPYAASMPGITHVMVNTLDRSSADLENYPDNSYVYAEETTTLVKGVSYEMTIGFTVDAFICPDMNLRVWIDLDQNGSFDDIGETVFSADHVSPNEFTDSFYLPDYALTGSTRMRVTAKMTSLGGHTLPTPCDLPHDPFGYHGEFEDYDITISESTGIANLEDQQLNATVYPNPAAGNIAIEWNSMLPASGNIIISSLAGDEIDEIMFDDSVNRHAVSYNTSNLDPGIYMISISSGNQTAHLKLIIV